MRFIKNVFSQLHSFVLWLLLSAVFWGWIFTIVTNAPIEKKITVYCYVPEMRDTALAVKLEEDMPEGLKMIEVHTFDYVKFSTNVITVGDIFIVPESKLEELAEILGPVDGENGVKVYDAGTGEGVAKSYITYTDEDHYLFLGAGSVHLEDGKALEVARRILELQ